MKALKALQILVAGAFALSMVACNNYTTAPVCNEQNAVSPPGMTGTYSVAVQKDDFTVETKEIVVGVDAKGHMKTRGLSRGLTKDGDEDSQICAINGVYVQEAYNETVKAYDHSRLYVTGMGLTTAPLFFDKASLDAAGIPNSIVDVPESAAKILGPTATHAVQRFATKLLADDPVLGLIVDNSSVYPEAVMARSYAAPVGLTLYRK